MGFEAILLAAAPVSGYIRCSSDGHLFIHDLRLKKGAFKIRSLLWHTLCARIISELSCYFPRFEVV